MLPEWGRIYLVLTATVLAAMVLGNYVIKDMGGRIDDAFGVYRANFITNGNCRFWYPSIIGTLLVKITDERKKKYKSVKYWKLGFYWFNSNSLLLLVQYMLPMKMEFFGEGCKTFRR
jgi:K(+)-stimulated pyrophosphate-energized sodium pump